MTRRLAHRLGVLVLMALAFGCGKKGNPLPPLRPVPARIADATASRSASGIEIRFTVPTANLDGTVPVALDRVDVYAVRSEAGAAPPTVAQVTAGEGNLVARIPIGPPATAEPVSTAERRPAPGEPAVYLHTGPGIEPGVTMHYTVVPVAGGGRGRPGPPAPLLSVPLDEFPGTPRGVSIDHDELALRVTWEPVGDGLLYQVLDAPAAGDGVALTPQPLSAPEFSVPVEFDREVCVVVRAVTVTSAVSVVGAASDRACATPRDRFPPPAPSGLRIVQEGGAVVLVWDAVDAADLAGYVVLRGVGTSADLTPLMRDPIVQTTYRDTTAVAGGTYTYAVYAVDSSAQANAGPTSEHQVLTLR